MTLQKIISEDLIPKNCPKCNYPLEWEGVHLICKGPQCIAKMIQQLDYFYGEHGVDLKSLGTSKIEKLLFDPECFTVLAEKPWALLDTYSYNIYHRLVPVLGEATANNILTSVASINNTKNAAHFIAGIGIEKVGFKTAYRLFNYIRYNKLHHRISKEAQRNFITGLTTFYLAQKEMKYFTFNDVPPPAQVLYSITGILHYGRNEMKEMLEEFGWEFSDTITTQVDFLIIGDAPGKKKPLMAKRYGIEIITERELYERLNKEKE